MTYTKHGHHIPGTVKGPVGEDKPPTTRCGGPRLCGDCALEVVQAQTNIEFEGAVRQAPEEELDLVKYVRTAFEVIAVRVSRTNMHAVARWCKGDIRASYPGKTSFRSYIHVEVFLPRNDRQSQAFVGDWILLSKNGFKVYSDRSFKQDFRRKQTMLTGDELATDVVQQAPDPSDYGSYPGYESKAFGDLDCV